MIDPIIFEFDFYGTTIALHWYGVILMTAIVIGAWLADLEFQRRGGSDEFIWNALIWVLPAGVIGARFWYALNLTLGGNPYFMDNPGKIFAITEGGLHIFGGLLFGGATAYWYAQRNKVDFYMILDSIAPSLLISQALARPANYINQELYGQPTDLPWGISILEENRIGEWVNMELYPASTRFHPTFAYEMVWNLVTGGILLYLVRKYPEKMKPGAAFAAWLLSAGAGRFLIEAFRPDQPVIPGTLLSYSRLIAAIMAIIGLVWLLVRFEKLELSFWKPGPDSYHTGRRRRSSKYARKTRRNSSKKGDKPRRKKRPKKEGGEANE